MLLEILIEQEPWNPVSLKEENMNQKLVQLEEEEAYEWIAHLKWKIEHQNA